MKQGQTSIRGGIEDILFPMQYCRILQGDGVGTHKGTYAVDNSGKDTGIDPVFAPCTMQVMDKWNYGIGNDIFIQSVGKVRFADGSIGYVTFRFIHDNYTSDIAVGRIFKQGEKFADEGTAGNASGNHMHIEVGKGLWTKGRESIKNSYGVWHLGDNMPIENACFMDGTTILAGTASWRYVKDVPVAPPANSNLDQVLYPGERFKFASDYLVEAVKGNLIYNSQLGGWLNARPLREVNGNNDQFLFKGEHFTIPGIFTCGPVTKTTVYVKELGYAVLTKTLTEVK